MKLRGRLPERDEWRAYENKPVYLLNKTAVFVLLIFLLALVCVIPCSSITLVTAGNHTYTIGETILISGTNRESDTTYLFLTGPDLDENGVVLTNFYQKAVNRQFTEVDVETDWTWQYRWSTTSVADNLQPGKYILYAATTPKTKAALSPSEYDSQSVTFVGTSEETTVPTPVPTTVPVTPSPSGLQEINRAEGFLEFGPYVSGAENVLWSNQYGRNDPELDYICYYRRNVFEKADMGIIFTGSIFYNDYENYRMTNVKNAILKLTADGHIQWAYEIDATNIPPLVTESGNGDIWLVTGYENLIIIGNDGTIKSRSLVGDWEKIHSLQIYPIAGGGCRVIGTSESVYPDAGYDLWYIDYDANGQNLGSNTFEKVFDESPVVMIQSASGDFICCSYTDTVGGPVKLIKIDGTGNINWERVVEIGSNHSIHRIIQLANGDYVAMGIAVHSGMAAADFDLWVFKFNEDGEILWSNLYGTSTPEIASDIEELSNGYLLVGGGLAKQDLTELKLWILDTNGVLLNSITVSDSSSATAITETEEGDILISSHRQQSSIPDYAPFGLMKMSLTTTGLTPSGTSATQQTGGSGDAGFIMNIPGYTACSSLIALLAILAVYSFKRRTG